MQQKRGNHQIGIGSGFRETNSASVPPNFKAQMDLARILIIQLNQDSTLVQRIAKFVDFYNKIQRRINEQKDREEKEALVKLKGAKGRGRGKKGSREEEDERYM